LRATEAKARVMSIRRTSEVPSTIEGMRVDLRGDAEAARHVGNGAEADFVAKLRRHGVDRIGESGAHVDLARVLAALNCAGSSPRSHRLVYDMRSSGL
jgi:hypothetical protein